MRVEPAVTASGIGAASAIRLRRRVSDFMLFALLMMASTFTAQSVSAQEPAEDTSEESSTPIASQRGEKVCRYEDVTGSRMRKRVCFTQDRWDAREMAAKTLARELDAKPVAGENNSGSSSGSGG